MTATKTNERPGTRAVHRHSGMSASKARQVLDLIRGEDVQRAAEILNGTEREAAEVIGKVLQLGRGQRGAQRPAEPRGALRLGLLRRRGRHHEALAPAGPGPGHPDPQADLPHHHHREPAAGRQARTAPPAHGGGELQPVPPGRGLAAPGRPVRPPVAPSGRPGHGRGRARPRPRRPRPRTTRRSPTRPWTRPRSDDAEPEVTEADTVDGGVDEDEDDAVEDRRHDEGSAAADTDEKSEDE